jgi:hypothetical protein
VQRPHEPNCSDAVWDRARVYATLVEQWVERALFVGQLRQVDVRSRRGADQRPQRLDQFDATRHRLHDP